LKKEELGSKIKFSKAIINGMLNTLVELIYNVNSWTVENCENLLRERFNKENERIRKLDQQLANDPELVDLTKQLNEIIFRIAYEGCGYCPLMCTDPNHAQEASMKIS